MSLDDLFDQPFLWRYEAANALRLDGDALLAALSPGASYPAVLRSVVDSLPVTVDVLVDVGAGPGAASEWLRAATGASVIAVEPAPGAREVARRCFPHLHVVLGTGTDTGLASGIADAVTLCGVLSLIHDADEVFDEVERIAAPGATIAIADLFADEDGFSSGPNVFRSIPALLDAIERRGWRIRQIGCGTPAVGASWAESVELVDRWIMKHRRGREGFGAWIADRLHLQRHIDHGDLLAGCIVAESDAPSTARSVPRTTAAPVTDRCRARSRRGRRTDR